MIGRRTLLRGAGAALGPALVPGHAQPRPARIGYIALRSEPNEFELAFLRGLRERGWVEGQNLNIDFRWAAFDVQKVQPMVSELLSLQPALIVVSDGSGALRLIRAQNPAVPIVVPMWADPIAQGATTSLARPDGNATGISSLAAELSGKRLELLKDAVPMLRRAGALYNASARPSVGVAVSAEAGRQIGVEVIEMPVRLPDGIDAALAAAVRQGVQAVAVLSSTATIAYRAPLGQTALEHRLLTIFSNRTYLKGGGLMSYGPDLESAFHRAAYYVDRLLKGASAAELPIERTSTFQLVLNQRTANALGLRLPHSLLQRADEVID